MKIRALKLRDRNFGNQWDDAVVDHWEYRDFKSSETWKKDWISFDSLCHEPASDTLYCGITSFDADIFWGWRRGEQEWFDAGYGRVRDPYDAKFHRSLELDTRSGKMYAAVALLHDLDSFWKAPGGSIVRYDPATNDISKLAIPLAHVYIQSIVLDEDCDMIYGQTFTPENLVSYNLASGESRWIGPTGSGLGMAQGENIVKDDSGNVWGVWNVTRAWQSEPGVDEHRFYKYSPEDGEIHYLDKGLPRPDGSYGYARPEGLFNLGDGNLYVSGDGGALYRLDPDTAQAEFLFRAIDTGQRRSRLASMRTGPDGLAYGVTGRDGRCEILRFDPKDGSHSLLGTLEDSETGEKAWQIHDVCLTHDGVLYAGENDNPYRSGYLWEVEL